MSDKCEGCKKWKGLSILSEDKIGCKAHECKKNKEFNAKHIPWTTMHLYPKERSKHDSSIE